MTAHHKAYPLLHQAPRGENYRIPDDPYDDESSNYIGEIEDVDLYPSDDEKDSFITVGLSQVTLFPSRKLVRENETLDLPDAECMLLSLCGMCLDDDQMLQLAQASDACQQDRNQGRRKPYKPPPVEWSQPVIIVPPEERSVPEPVVLPRNTAGGKQVQFDQATTSRKSNQKVILLHGRVARALGIKNGDRVTVKLEGQTKRQLVRASVDDRASFNVVLEADWLDILSNNAGLVKSKNPSKRNTLLRSVDLRITTEMDLAGDYDRTARFYLTPRDHRRQGILYFEASIGANHPRHSLGLVAGTGFCVYSCSIFNGFDDQSDDSSSDEEDRRYGSRRSSKLPRNETELVSSFRFLGRPYCTNHAEYSALIEGLEWLFRFHFNEVHIVGAPVVLEAVQKPRRKKSGAVDDEDEVLNIPQLQRANSIAQGMIERAKRNGVKFEFWPALYDESWEAGELADKAVDENRNYTQVHWDNVEEARPIDPKYYHLNSSLTYSEDSSPPLEQANSEDTLDKRMNSEDEMSSLKGEDVLDADFSALENPPLCTDVAETLDRTSMESCTSAQASKVEVPFDEQKNYAFTADKVATESEHNEQEEEEVVLHEEGMKCSGGPSLHRLSRKSGRWHRLAKAIRHRSILTKVKKGCSNNNQSDVGSQDQRSLEDDRSTWLAPSLSPATSNEFSKSIDSRNDSDEEKEADSSDDDAGLFRNASPKIGDASGDAPSGTSDAMCFLMDLEFLQGAQVLADDVVRIFSGYRSSGEEEKEDSSRPASPRVCYSGSTSSKSAIEPPSPHRLVPSEIHQEILYPLPPQSSFYEKRYADV